MNSRKVKKGLSNAISALILVVASVILTLVVVGYTFGIMGAFISIPEVEQIGTGTIASNGTATFLLRTTGNTQIMSVQLAGTNDVASSFTPATLNVGINTVSANFKNLDILQGSIYSLAVTLSSGETVYVTVIAT